MTTPQSKSEGLQGLRCPVGRGNVDFSFCEGECLDPCHPLPLLAALLESREVVPGVYSVTEILKPYQAIYLSRHNPYWVDPEGQIYMVAGSAAHSIIEEGGKRLTDQANHLTEIRGDAEIETPNGVAHLRGTYDYYDVRRKGLWDFKNSKVFPVKKLKKAVKDGAAWYDEDYFKQLNVYRAYFRPEAESLWLEVMVQGWTVRDSTEVRRIEQIEVPVADINEVKDFVSRRLSTILANEKDPDTIPKCTLEETWGWRRCADYCNCRDFCSQAIAHGIVKEIS